MAHRTTSVPTENLLTKLQKAVRSRLEVHTRRRELEHQLAAYRTPTEINELLLIISRDDSSSADAVRAVLDDNLASWAREAA